MRGLIIGAGEIGSSLYRVLNDHHETYIRDVDEKEVPEIEVLNICFPYSDSFEEYVREYVEKYKPKATIVHSTVPVGTCRELGVVHSPVRGKHPHLDKGIKTFVKYLGGPEEQVEIAKDYLESAKIQVDVFDSSDDTEAAKLLSLQYYGLCITFMKEVMKVCDEKGLNFEQVYTHANMDYNDGWIELSEEQFIRPVLEWHPGKIGGHCVIQAGCALLDTPISDFVNAMNETYAETS